MPSVAVRYEKTFLSGLLAGHTVPGRFPCPDRAHAERSAETLRHCTTENPGHEAVTGNAFVVSNVTIEECE